MASGRGPLAGSAVVKPYQDEPVIPLSCVDCINFQSDKGCDGETYRICRSTPKIRRLFNINVRGQSLSAMRRIAKELAGEK